MADVSRGGGVLEVDQFQYDVMKRLANNEDRPRENFERIILVDKKMVQELLDLDGIDPSKHQSREVRKHLHEEVVRTRRDSNRMANDPFDKILF